LRTVRARGVTLIEVLVASGLLAMVMLAVLSFYINAVAVSSKKDEQSERLRRFSIGMEKIEQVLREARVVQLEARLITFHVLDEGLPVRKGFPNYSLNPAQLVSTAEGVVLLHQSKKEMLLPTREGEHTIFRFLTEEPDRSPPPEPKGYLLSVALYSHSETRSDQFIHRTINMPRY